MSRYEIEYPTPTPGRNQRVAAEAVRDVLQQVDAKGNRRSWELTQDWLNLAALRLEQLTDADNGDWDTQTVEYFVHGCRFVEVPSNPQLDRIEAKLDALAAELAKLNDPRITHAEA